MKKALTGFLFLFIAQSSFGQETITLKYFGLTIHPFGDESAHLQPNRLDKEARFVVNSGLFIGYEKFVHEDLVSIKVIQGLLQDCSNGFASVSHVGLRIALKKTDRHRIYFGIGPTFIARDSWNRFGTLYESSGYFNEIETERFGDVQWKFIPYAFEFEYDYAFTPTNQLSVSFTPGFPIAGLVSIGWKHWFNIKDYGMYDLYVPKD